MIQSTHRISNLPQFYEQLLGMNLNPIPSFPTLSGEVFDSLPESIRSYIRYLEATIQQL